LKDINKIVKNKPKVLCIVGATASGKTNAAIQAAKEFNGEIISADSRLVYHDFNIGTAKPTLQEQEGVPHHMIDIQSPLETYTVGKYKIKADEKIKEILNKNKLPIVAGGTGFYIKALLAGLNIPDVDPDEKFREEMENLVKNKGKEALYHLLKKSDPKMAEKLMPNDSFRIIRALEVQKATGEKMSTVQTVSDPEYNVIYTGLNAENRDLLYERINKRVEIMLQMGLIDEVKGLIHKYGRTNALLKTLGYREICEFFDGKFSQEEAVALIQKNTRNFAKRQLTWFRANKEINWFFIDKSNDNDILKEMAKIL